jgi:hypothetical protein
MAASRLAQVRHQHLFLEVCDGGLPSRVGTLECDAVSSAASAGSPSCAFPRRRFCAGCAGGALQWLGASVCEPGNASLLESIAYWIKLVVPTLPAPFDTSAFSLGEQAARQRHSSSCGSVRSFFGVPHDGEMFCYHRRQSGGFGYDTLSRSLRTWFDSISHINVFLCLPKGQDYGRGSASPQVKVFISIPLTVFLLSFIGCSCRVSEES